MDFRKLFDEFLVDSDKAKNGNKSAGVRARKKSVEITEKLKEFRKESLKW